MNDISLETVRSAGAYLVSHSKINNNSFPKDSQILERHHCNKITALTYNLKLFHLRIDYYPLLKYILILLGIKFHNLNTQHTLILYIALLTLPPHLR